MENLPVDKSIMQEDKFLNALADAYRLQEAIISTTELAVISTNTKGIITSFNKAAEAMLGYSAEEVIGKFTPIIFHDLDEIILSSENSLNEEQLPLEPGFNTLITGLSPNHTADRREWTYVRKDGSRFPVSVSMAALRDESGSLIGYASIATDITQQREISEKIRKSEMHLHALVSSIEDVIYEVNEDGRYLNAWSKSKRNLSFPESDIIGRTLRDMYGARFAQPFDEILQTVIKTGKPHNFEYKSRATGDERWFKARYSLIYDNDEPTNRVSISIHDITDRKKAEFALKESEQRFRLLAENIPGVIYLCNNDLNYSMLYLNDKVREVTGYTKEEFLNGLIHFEHIFHPEDRESIHQAVNDGVENRRSFHIKYRIKHKSGDWRWLEEYGIGVYDDQQLLWIEGFISDITEQKQSEDELLRISEENVRIFNSTGLNAIIGFDGYFKRLNHGWEKMLGWSKEELLMAPFYSFVHADDITRTRIAYEQALGGNEINSFENRYRCKDGTYRWLLWTSSSDVKREIIYGSAVDITERKRTEEELLLSKHDLEAITIKLQEQNAQLDEFAHIISHNLRSPVGNIEALISFLREDSTMDDYKLIFNKLKNVSKNMSETMNELMDTLQIRKSTEIERVDLRFKDVLDKVVQSLEGNLIQCGASLTYDFNEVAKINYPKTYLESIFQNLLSNAIKYRSEERPLEIHFSSDLLPDGTVVLKIRDNGLGIDMNRFGDKLFGMHKTFHEHKEARGIGLFLTKTQVETMGGRIHAISEVNKGTTFTIEF